MRFGKSQSIRLRGQGSPSHLGTSGGQLSGEVISSWAVKVKRTLQVEGSDIREFLLLVVMGAGLKESSCSALIPPSPSLPAKLPFL